MRGVVRFYNPDLQVALIERDNGLTLGSIESGHCAVNDVLLGHFRDERSGRVRNTSTDSDVRLRVEAEAITPEEGNELVTLLRC
ncbi:hypothetical protein [Pinirhizobacter soli]|uniref:hypothetical protein n=1 Tax=Pinirhizobacter soli TaxID=2786953 RepID=UPI00202A8194|nr:hypothetical protein [Pinirhizobacter soli]